MHRAIPTLHQSLLIGYSEGLTRRTDSASGEGTCCEFWDAEQSPATG